MEQNQDLPEIGYLFYFPKFDEPGENFRLDVFVSSIPTEMHFDVQHVKYNVRNEHNITEHLTVSHPWTSIKSATVCPGTIIMEDRNGKKEEAFSFGGQLSIEEKEAQTICSLVSPAPILEISTANPMQKLFVEELGIIVAEKRAMFADEHAYRQKVCSVEPFALYQACLHALVEKFEALPKNDETNQRFLFFLHSHVRRMKAAGVFQGYFATLEDIFKK